MKKKIIILALCALSLVACTEKRDSIQNIEDQTQLVKSAQVIDSVYMITGVMNETEVRRFVDAALDFANSNPADETAPELLAKAGGYCMRMANVTSDKELRAMYSKQAISIFDKIIAVYPDNPIVKYCYWWKGIIYEDILQMLPSAENEYREFLHKFPDDTLAISIKYSLEHLGETTSEVLLENE
ncbi:MAG: hypothetical protein IJT51_07665 [Bacteroidales bacterium]|nr:hypothetical protein [Bacteroidales bacterium]